jgi:hypothetical protein
MDGTCVSARWPHKYGTKHTLSRKPPSMQQCSGMRKRLRCGSVLTKTRGIGHVIESGSINLAPGSSASLALESIPGAGRSGNVFPAGTERTSALPPVFDTKKNLPSEDHPDKQSGTQISRFSWERHRGEGPLTPRVRHSRQRRGRIRSPIRRRVKRRTRSKIGNSCCLTLPLKTGRSWRALRRRGRGSLILHPGLRTTGISISMNLPPVM